MFAAERTCTDCHGGMLAVAGVHKLASGKHRTPWIEEPKCQSCHTGDVLDHIGDELILRQAYDPSDPAAIPRLASNQRFAENLDTLYRNSIGHGGMMCTSCHGSPHAIWPVPNTQANDNLMATQLQGHAGTLIECATCHTDGSLSLGLNGPHGVHPVNTVWNKQHKFVFQNDAKACIACHGRNLEGTVLSRTHTDRQLITKDWQRDRTKKITLAKGTVVSCTLCHDKPRVR